MKRHEYLYKKKELEKNHQFAIQKLAREYVISNCEVKIGDKITDHIGSIIVEVINTGWGYTKEYPIAIFRGPEITKKGNFFKSGSKRSVWGDNRVVTKNDK